MKRASGMGSRGQAALEYLVTYGWGILAILVVIGALSYFGFLNPTRYLPASCEFGAQLQCVDFQLWESNGATQAGRIRLQFRNNFGDDINITSMWIAGNPVPLNVVYDIDGDGGFAGEGRISLARSRTISKGNLSNEFRLRMMAADGHGPVLVEGDRATMPVIVEFRRDAAGSPLHNVTGTVFATVQAEGLS